MKEGEYIKKRYIEAKLIHEELKTIWSKIVEPYNEQLKNNEISDTEWAEKITHLEFELGLPEAFEQLYKAERALVDWAHKRLEPELTEEQRKTLGPLWAKWWRYPSIEDKLINLCLRLEEEE
jgi:hypothetical protein